MKLGIIILVMWYLVLEFWVWRAEQKSKVDAEIKQQELLKKAREREEWAKRYGRYT